MVSRSLIRVHLLALGTVWIVMAGFVGVVGDFPVNDDWIYGGATHALLTDGSFRIPGPTIANVFSQAYWGLLFCLPFGFSYTALRGSTLLLGLIGLWALYALVRENGGSARSALAGSLCLASYPLYFASANSFMTEVPFLAATLIAMLCLMRFFRTGSTIVLLAGTSACLATVLIRQVGLAVPLAFLIVNLVRYRTRPLAAMTGALPLVVAAAGHVIYQQWLISSGRGPEVYFSGILQLVPSASIAFLTSSVWITLYSLPYIGLPVLSIALITRMATPDALSQRAWRVVCLIGVALGLLVLSGPVWRGDRLPVLGNVLMEWGLGPLTQRDTYLLHQNLPEPGPATAFVWTVATALGVAGSIALAQRIAVERLNWDKRLRHNNLTTGNWTSGFVILTAAIYWGLMLLLLNKYGNFFDRYVLPMVAFGIVIFCLEEHRTPRALAGPRAIAGWALIACMGLLSVGMTHDYLAWNRARWAVLTELTGAGGVPPRQIDGGYEFNGLMMYDPHYLKSPGKSYWWVADDEYVLASGPLPGYREVSRRPVDRWLPSSVSSVITLRRL